MCLCKGPSRDGCRQLRSSGPCYALNKNEHVDEFNQNHISQISFPILHQALRFSLHTCGEQTQKTKTKLQKLNQCHVWYQHLFIVIKTSEYKVHSQVQQRVTELLCLIPTANQRWLQIFKLIHHFTTLYPINILLYFRINTLLYLHTDSPGLGQWLLICY